MVESLIIKGLTIDSETRRVIDNIAVELVPGKIAVMLGPNGAGKSEFVLGVAGVLPSTGEVRIGQKNLNGAGTQLIRTAGIAAVPEGHRVLSGLSVLDNLKAAGPMLGNYDLKQEVNSAFEIFPELRTLSANKAGSMSGGQQQMLAIAQALMSRPKFLLIDEMSLGLAPVIIERLIGVVRALKEKGVGILLIEQFTQLALNLADHCYVMSQGRLQYSGPPSKLKSNPEILQNAYLGT